MRSRFIWLMPILLLLISVIGSGNAYAHHSLSSGLQATASEHEVWEGGIPSDVQVSVILADESGEPCDCPGGHCTCNVNCFAMCAATSAITNTIVFDVLPSRSMVAIETVTIPSSWIPIGDFDPPRPFT
jgi:hypothetical protein